MNGAARNRYLQRRYNITQAEYLQILKLQGNKCAGCHKPVSHFKRPLHVDHDHSTHLVRGLLCWRCNDLLPCRKDLYEVLVRLIEYLQFPPAERVIGLRKTP